VSDVVPFPSPDEPADPAEEIFEELEDRVREHFRTALDGAFTSSFEEARHCGLGKMSIETFVELIKRALEAESARLFAAGSI
jgi:hypothetical protein